MVYYVFDLLHLDGQDLTGSPLIERKRALGRAARDIARRTAWSGSASISSRRPDDAQARLQSAPRRHRVEARRCALSLRPRRRLAQDQMLQQPGVHRHRLRAVRQARPADPLAAARLLRQGRAALRRPDRHRLGPEGGARPARAARRRRAQRHAARQNPRGGAPREREMGRAELVVEVDFRGWTGGKLVRQGSFKGVREDKPAKQVVREVEQMPANRSSRPHCGRRSPTKVAAAKPAQIGQIQSASRSPASR